jgi:hypothetical protein
MDLQLWFGLSCIIIMEFVKTESEENRKKLESE